jgi:hypothetical protein
MDVGPILFPSTPNIQSALPIDLRPGQEFRGADIQMTPIRRYTVCGVVRGIPARQARVQNNPGGPIPRSPLPRRAAIQQILRRRPRFRIEMNPVALAPRRSNPGSGRHGSDWRRSMWNCGRR